MSRQTSYQVVIPEKAHIIISSEGGVSIVGSQTKTGLPADLHELRWELLEAAVPYGLAAQEKDYP
jgi:hypothetical protein